MTIKRMIMNEFSCQSVILCIAFPILGRGCLVGKRKEGMNAMPYPLYENPRVSLYLVTYERFNKYVLYYKYILFYY